MRNKEFAFLKTDKRIGLKVNLPLKDQPTFPYQEQSTIQDYPELAFALNAGLTEVKSLG